MQNAKQEFPCQSLESFSREYYDMENKILSFQLEPVCTKQTHPNYSLESNQDDAEIQQHDRLSTKEWCNYEKCEKMPSSLECVCCNKILAVKVFY